MVMKLKLMGQWGNPRSISTGTRYSFRIGKRWDNNQRFVGAIDDVRLYSAGFSEFEIQKLVKESSGLPVDLGEDSYTPVGVGEADEIDSGYGL